MTNLKTSGLSPNPSHNSGQGLQTAPIWKGAQP